MPYEKIVFGTDGSLTANVAERVAVEIAKAAHATLVVVSAYSDEEGKDLSERAVAASGGRAETSGVQPETEVVEGEPAAAITEVADRGDADLIVVGDVGLGGPKRFRLGGIADQVSHNMPCDLLIVRTSKPDPARAPGSYGRVLIGTDGSPTAARAVRVGNELAAAMGAGVELVYVGEEVMGGIVLRDAAGRLGGDVATRTLQGDPGEQIVELAGAEGHDLVVVGNKGMGGALRFLLGAVPDKVSHLAPCDVLVVNTTGRSLEDLEPGEGAVVTVGRKKVAAYRDPSGALTTLLPKCKHLGCTVGWNHRASTWDCPCHGSRYDASGKVIQGPAQRDLDPLELDSA
jgi:nucleotide-binding universal stress UspA family protein/nitrite reductase/ring-hydroxylating ferredoxin subunit